MICIFDIDGTIVKTKNIKTMLENVLNDEFQISDFEDLYEQYSLDEKYLVFTFEHFAEFIVLKHPQLNREDLAQSFLRGFQEIKDLEVEGLREYIERLKSQGDKVIILSWGDVEFQKAKLSKVGLLDVFCDHLEFVNSSKDKMERLRIIREQNGSEKIVVFNDKKEENREFREIHGVEVIDVDLECGFPFDKLNGFEGYRLNAEHQQ